MLPWRLAIIVQPPGLMLGGGTTVTQTRIRSER
jgi:hypothetical protein